MNKFEVYIRFTSNNIDILKHYFNQLTEKSDILTSLITKLDNPKMVSSKRRQWVILTLDECYLIQQHETSFWDFFNKTYSKKTPTKGYLKTNLFEHIKNLL